MSMRDARVQALVPHESGAAAEEQRAQQLCGEAAHLLQWGTVSWQVPGSWLSQRGAVMCEPGDVAVHDDARVNYVCMYAYICEDEAVYMI
jgi:hypothetical protein